ncbi:MAG: GxGYxYP family putative glycoside hydrolase [Ignavibacteria bacterium]|nr:GxGYxYP family putative glycoside hydrolase [Ignavibacteria bacterium]
MKYKNWGKHKLFSSKVIFFLLVLVSQTKAYDAVFYNMSASPWYDKLIAMTLAGIVNRDSSQLYLSNVYETWSYNQTDERWAEIYAQKGNVIFDTVKTIPQLLTKFSSYIGGGISFDQNATFGNFTGQSFRWQAEYAALIGGLSNRLPVTPQLAQLYGLNLTDSVFITDYFDGDSPKWVTGKLELSSHIWNSISTNSETRYLALLDWGINNLLPLCNPNKFYIRELTDFTIKHRMFQVNLAGTDALDFNSLPSQRADIIERVLNYLQSKNQNKIFHIYGWMHPEPLTQWFACFGASFHETLMGNLSWHTSFPLEERQFIPKSSVDEDTITLSNKFYILFISSEGDAANWVMSFQSGAWLSASRGLNAVGWGWNFYLFNEAPFVAAYYYDSATPKDGFLSVTSPLGYAYPDLWGSNFFSNAVDSTRSLMDKFNINNIYGYKHYAPGYSTMYRGKTIYNSFQFQKYADFQTAIGAKLTMIFDPMLPTQTPNTQYGALLFNHVNDGSFYGNASDLQTFANTILNNIKLKQKPGFILAGYQRFRQEEFYSRPSPSTSDISLSRLNTLISYIKADPTVGNDVEVVTPELFSALMRKKLGISNIPNETDAPSSFALMQNYPNPFNPSTTICYAIAERQNVTMKVYDILGKEIVTLLNEEKDAGYYQIEFDAEKYSLASGVYFCELILNNNISKKIKIVYLK